MSESTDIEIQRLRAEDVDAVVEASALFDFPVARHNAVLFLGSDGHHILIAYADGAPVGFVSGVETTHPDKGTEMFLYELSVDERHRRRGIGTALVSALAGLARERGCYGMWVATEPDNMEAIATYRSAGAGDVEPFVTLSWAFPVS